MVVNAEPGRIGPQEYRGLSTDTKPADAPNQSVFLETDTSKIYFYGKDSATWNEWSAGGGGDATSNVVILDYDEVMADKAAAYERIGNEMIDNKLVVISKVCGDPYITTQQYLCLCNYTQSQLPFIFITLDSDYSGIELYELTDSSWSNTFQLKHRDLNRNIVSYISVGHPDDQNEEPKIPLVDFETLSVEILGDRRFVILQDIIDETYWLARFYYLKYSYLDMAKGDVLFVFEGEFIDDSGVRKRGMWKIGPSTQWFYEEENV